MSAPILTGTHTNSLDEKKRVALPRRLRERFDSEILDIGLWVTRGYENSLLLYTRDQWDRASVEVTALSSNMGEARRFQRLFLGGAERVKFDRQNRFRIPDELIAHANIKEKVVFLGVGRHIEIWAKEEYENYLDGVKPGEYEKLAETALSASGAVNGPAVGRSEIAE